MVLRTRGEFANQTDTIQLQVEFKNRNGVRADLPAYPTVSIIQPSGNVTIAPTSSGVYRVDTGVYGFDYSICYNCAIGVWTDYWEGYDVDGYYVYSSGNFVVENTMLPGINTDGYIHLGDDVPFNYSQNATLNINKVIKVMRARLNSSGKARLTDTFGNVEYEDCDIFDVNQLATFAANALAAFNEIPYTTWFTWEDTEFFDNYVDVIAQHAIMWALASKVMLERGREFDITDNGASFRPPGVSDVLQSQYTTELQNWYEKVKMIKASMRPNPMGLGTLRPLATNPALMRLRHLRQRQIV